jgi:hypothetical protein
MRVFQFICAVLLLLPLSFAQASHPASMSMPLHEPAVAQTSSGTSWDPASSPEFMWMTNFQSWMVMAHGELMAGYYQSGGEHGVGKAGSSNWLMLMEHHSLGRGTLEFRQMLSAEPLTSPHPGYPTLFQTGETYKGVPLVDYQHPHDVLGEISLRLTYPLGERLSWFLYGGPAAEPALGPTAFLHRVSAMDNPVAPLGHHLQDSTHISYGVVTSGVVLGPVKLEGSAFNGREPDERRYNFDFGPLDSWSARVSAAPSRNWVAQYSYGHLVHPEAAEPGNADRQTASVGYNRPLPHGYSASTLIWGRNHQGINDRNTNSYLFESAFNFAEKNYVYTRLELVDKDELNLSPPLNGRSFRIGSYTFGGVRDFVHHQHGQIGVGVGVTFYSKPSVLDPIYGQNPVSLNIFLRLRPGRMQM